MNLVYLVPGESGGMETYARELIPALLSERPDLQVTAFINREATEAREGPWHELVRAVTVPVCARRRPEWVRGEQQLLPRLAREAGVDLLHSLASTAPATGRFRRVVTIHDLIYKHYPEAHFGLRSLAMRILVPLAARRSHRIIVPSQSTRDDLIGVLRVPPAKVDVVAEGVGATFRVQSTPESEIRDRYELGTRPVLLSVSARRPHKNLARLLSALALIPAERRPVLILPGYPTVHDGELQRIIALHSLAGDVRLTGWVPAAELEGLYRAASCFVFPSLYEGFGLPVLEAMARGLPVASSDRGSLPEVAGGAARFFDPESPRAIADAVEAILFDPEEAARLRMLGLDQAAKFSWRTAGRQTIAAYERALASE